METNATCCGVLLPRCTFYMKFMQCRRTRCSLYVWDVQIYWPTFTILLLHPHLTLIICWRMSHEYVILRYCTEDMYYPSSEVSQALGPSCFLPFFFLLSLLLFFLFSLHTYFAACRQSYLTICYFVHGEMFDVWEMMKFCSRYILHQRTSVDTCQYMYVLGICLYLYCTSAVHNPYMSCLLLGYQLWGS